MHHLFPIHPSASQRYSQNQSDPSQSRRTVICSMLMPPSRFRILEPCLWLKKRLFRGAADLGSRKTWSTRRNFDQEIELSNFTWCFSKTALTLFITFFEKWIKWEHFVALHLVVNCIFSRTTRRTSFCSFGSLLSQNLEIFSFLMVEERPKYASQVE